MPFLEVTVRKLVLIILAVISTAVIASVTYASVFPMLFPSTPLQAVQVAAGNMHTCAVTPKGEAMCWGANWAGQLGDGTTESRSHPTTVSGLDSGVTSISVGGSRGCAVQNGSVFCWGSNPHGQLGNGTNIDSLVPVRVSGLNNVVSVAVGTNFTCALTGAEAVYCWGLNGFDRPGMIKCCMLGDGSVAEIRMAPTSVYGLTSGVASIAMGETHACALTTDGVVGCWGHNSSGQLGDGTTVSRGVATRVSLSEPVAAIAASGLTTCAVTMSGAGYCWGNNGNGVIGDGSTENRMVPTPVAGLTSGATMIATGGLHTCAIADTVRSAWGAAGGSLRCWGDNQYGQFGNGTKAGSYAPMPIDTASVIAASMGSYHSCALVNRMAIEGADRKVVGVAQCWGNNEAGQIGDGTEINRNEPVDVLM